MMHIGFSNDLYIKITKQVKFENVDEVGPLSKVGNIIVMNIQFFRIINFTKEFAIPLQVYGSIALGYWHLINSLFIMSNGRTKRTGSIQVYILNVHIHSMRLILTQYYIRDI